MPRMVCRLRLRAGEPLGLLVYPGPTFLSLPLEIRNEIYRLLLTSPDPVIVFPPSSTEQARLHSYTMGLLRVNKIIAAEAAAMFFKQNIFKLKFSADYGMKRKTDCWDALYSFLLVIGARNRSYLRYLEADITLPGRISIDAHGTVSSTKGPKISWLREVHARDEHTRTYPPVYDDMSREPSFDYISPAIGGVFRLLGHEGPMMQLSLFMEDQNIPHLIEYPSGAPEGWSSEVPNFIEILRRRFTCDSDGQPRVEVLWKGTLFKSRFVVRSEKLKQDGWEILEVSHAKLPNHLCHILGPEFREVSSYTLRRRNTAYDRSAQHFESIRPLYE